MPEKISICLIRAGRLESLVNVDVSIVYARIVQSHFDTFLRYVLTVTFCGRAVLKVMDQKTLVKRR